MSTTIRRYLRIEPRNGGDRRVGHGSYGDVYLARDTVTGKKVAMKTLKISVLDEGIPKTSVREIALLKHLSHPCIVKLLDQECYGGKLHMIFEFVDQDLKRYMDLINGPMKPENIKSITSQIVQGVDYCHMNGVLHRDLKPQNILVSNSLNVKIADFGMARAFVPPMRRLTHEVVSLWYRPPEILLGTDVYSLPADMWAVGAILAEMIGMRPLFFARSEVELLINIFKILGTPTSTIWPEVTKLRYWNGDFPKFPSLKINKFLPDFCEDGIGMIEQLLVMDPRNRMSANEALKHSYLEGSVCSNSEV